VQAVVCSVCSRHYLPQALTMIWSIKRFGGEVSFYLLLSDITSENRLVLADEYPGIEFLFIDEVADQGVLDSAVFLSDLEFNTSLKGLVVSKVAQGVNGPVFFCDSDLFFLKAPTEALAELSYASVLLTPHQNSPTTHRNDLVMTRCGVFNSGFFGVRGEAGREMAKWLQEKSLRFCLMEPDEGLFVEQKWFDLIPAIFDNVAVFKNAGYNVGYWNITRIIDLDAITMLHLSGFDFAKRGIAGSKLSRHSGEVISGGLSQILALYINMFEEYKGRCDKLFSCYERSAIERYFSVRRPIVTRRNLVYSLKFEVRGRKVYLRRRGASPAPVTISLYRTQSSLITLVRYLGRLVVAMRLGGVLESTIVIFKILGRRSNWVPRFTSQD
jgi:hypothetical protein